MAKTIHQTVRFEATADDLYDLYMNSKLHTAALGAAASMSTRVDGAFSVWDGYATGHNLALAPKRLVVQTWRESAWPASTPDSILILTFGDVDGGAEFEMVHANVPDDAADELSEGWVDNYWIPWKAWLTRAKSAAKPRRKAGPTSRARGKAKATPKPRARAHKAARSR